MTTTVECVHAPIDGTVTNADRGTVTVYVAPTDAHDIYSPVYGMITGFREESGEWTRPGTFNVPDQTKTGRLVIEMATDGGRRFEFWIEVGHGTYITDTIKITSRPGELLSKGTPMGEIVVGSLYEMHLGDAQILAKVGNGVKGAVTPLAIFS